MKNRLGVDIGGTFTDLVLEVGAQQYSTKVLTTYAAPENAIIDGMQKVCALANIEPDQIDQIIHGTTLATNALIERSGAKTALITTKGFRDVIEMRTESRFEQYDLNLELPEPLVPRHQRYTVKERIGAQGEVLIELERAEVIELATHIKQANYDSVAVGLLHAYANPNHEKMVREVLAEIVPQVMVSISSEVSPQMREYERFNTVVANAYIKPLMKSYLSRLKGRLSEYGVGCDVFLMHSGGGIISLESAAEFPVRLVESGPAGGAVFAATIAKQYGLNKVLSFDMGGTTAKICLIDNQAPKTSRVFEVARTYRFKKGSGMPISIPVIDMVEIGAGGGSLAHVDSMQQIRTGPESAGSEPGPACYGRGGERPAVTDADLVLGKLDPNNFAGGSIPLSAQNAETALTSAIGSQLGMDAQTAAFGVAEVVDENMANAARVHAVENGEDLAEYTMIAFGGAAPLHAGRLCEKLGVQRLLVPEGAGVGSAIGFLRAPFSFEATRSVVMPLSRFASASITALFSELENEAIEFVRRCDGRAAIHSEYKVYMRYIGQGWEIPVMLSASQAKQPHSHTYQQLFEAEYQTLFGRSVAGMDIEITGWSVNSSSSRTTSAVSNSNSHRQVESTAATPTGTRVLFDAAQGKPCRANEYTREQLQTSQTMAGPAVIVENETSIIVPASAMASKQADGCIDLQFSSTAAQAQAKSANTVFNQVMWNRLISIVEEQAQALIRTAFSTSVREAGDLSAGVYDHDGRMLAQAVTGTPGHVNAMAESVQHFIRRIGRENIFEGDVYITNDPWEGTGHLHDITVVTPSFTDQSLVGFFACTSHVVDIGGRGFGADAESIYEEGLYIPIMKLMERGNVNQPFLHLVRSNVREPDQVVGDIYALSTCNQIGHQRLQEMMHEFQLVDLNDVAGFILENSRRATLEKIAALPRKTAHGEMIIDGYDSPISLKANVAIEWDRVLCDFAGSSSVDKKGINVPLVYTQAYSCYALKCAIAPEIPNNAASLAPFVVTAPDNTILNAQHPAPVALRHVVGQMLPDTVYNALDKILPNRVPAEGASTLCNFQVSLRPRSDETAPNTAVRAEVLTFNSGGAGARPGIDGLNATAFPSGVMTMPVEATEHTGPIIIWRKELRPDSGGVGEYRGGLGQYMEVSACEGHEFDLSAMFDRVKHPAQGRHGGGSGAVTKIAKSDGSNLPGKGKQFVAHGERVSFAFPGGGGYGNASDRLPALVRRDLAHGYISAESAAQDYGMSKDEIDAVQSAVVHGEFEE